ncbi:DNA repair helicase XPB [Paenibacillus humicola]|uniref:DNA repair helicase XPB n=1 Tax=Paenibacillus humicola TaxID=3110540 RepID=UPI00237A8562|nr:DNA repair helicase XPB [Paenibacillus humicola]
MNHLEPKPLIVQSDFTVLLDDRLPDSNAAREALAKFADLTKRPGDMHTYRITPLSIWNAASSGMSAVEMIGQLRAYSRYEVPSKVTSGIRDMAGRYGKLTLVHGDEGLRLAGDEALLREIAAEPSVNPYVGQDLPGGPLKVKPESRGLLKQELMRLGYPVLDKAGYRPGEALDIALRERTLGGFEFRMRDYQERAVDLFYREGSAEGGSGVLVLPCGAGKTIVGIAAMARLGCDTLILTSNATSVSQWKRELLDKTTLEDRHVGEYAAKAKQVRPVTIATYQMLTGRRQKDEQYRHMNLFGERNWGLIIYDEVHLLPAPVFRMTADLQATRRLGLTATLIREDGREEDVFSLIGPKRFDLPWRMLEYRRHIASAACAEIRVPLPDRELERYERAKPREQVRIAAENTAKIAAVKELLRRHEGKPALVIGQYLSQLGRMAEELQAPVLTGELPHPEREELYATFKRGEIPVLVVSKVANFAVDLPDAAVAIQVSGSYGSRQEEAQRIGRILRPKAGDNSAWYYTVVSDGTKEIEYARKRQLFLLEQGYRYGIRRWPFDASPEASSPLNEPIPALRRQAAPAAEALP